MTKQEIANLLHSLEKQGLTQKTLLTFVREDDVIEHLGYAKAFEIYMKHKYDLVKLYPLEEDFVCLNVDLDEFILEIVGNSLKRLRLILKNDYEDFKDEDRLFMEVSEAYCVFPNDNAFIEYFEEHNFLVYQFRKR